MTDDGNRGPGDDAKMEAHNGELDRKLREGIDGKQDEEEYWDA